MERDAGFKKKSVDDVFCQLISATEMQMMETYV